MDADISLIRFDCRKPGATSHADLIATGVRMRVRLANALFPYPAVTAGLLARIDEFLRPDAADPGLAGSSATTVTQPNGCSAPEPAPGGPQLNYRRRR